MGRVGTTDIPYTPIVLEEGVVSCGSDGTTGAETGFHEFVLTFDYNFNRETSDPDYDAKDQNLVISMTNTDSNG